MKDYKFKSQFGCHIVSLIDTQSQVTIVNMKCFSIKVLLGSINVNAFCKLLYLGVISSS